MGLSIFTALGWICLRPMWGGRRTLLFALLNIAALTGLAWARPNGPHLAWIPVYLLIATLQLWLIRFTASRSPVWTWAAIMAPVLFMVTVRYFPIEPDFFIWRWLGRAPHSLDSFFGLSYVAFRLSYLALEVRQGLTKNLTWSEFISFAFFGPAMILGPLTPSHVFVDSLRKPIRYRGQFQDSLLRLTVGGAKYLFLAPMIERMTLAGIFPTGKEPNQFDFFFGALMTYPHLYCNFSGLCDIVIGVGGILGLRIAENFNNPFAARNLTDFWRRWHITLGVYMRDIVFTPMSRTLAGRLPRHLLHLAMALPTLAIFMLIGWWHGGQPNYLMFGALNGLAVVANQYYALLLKKFLSKKQWKAYQDNTWIRAVMIGITFVYVAGTVAVFSTPLPKLVELWKSLSALP
jgi:D-alanyl-lipoteichoic acid acyltransferase DltB (MBOAT superfamily)